MSELNTSTVSFQKQLVFSRDTRHVDRRLVRHILPICNDPIGFTGTLIVCQKDTINTLEAVECPKVTDTGTDVFYWIEHPPGSANLPKGGRQNALLRLRLSYFYKNESRDEDLAAE